MTCAELKEQLGALAAGALDPAERAACEAHLALDIPHHGCAEALAHANEAAALLGAALPPVEPGPDVWHAIEAEVGLGAAAAPKRASRQGGRARWWVAGFAMAASVTIVFMFGVREVNDVSELRDQVSQLTKQLGDLQGAAANVKHDLERARADLAAQREALAMLQLSTTAVIALAPPGASHGGMRASALYNPQQGHAMVVASGLMPHAGKDYELWVIRGDHKMAAGLLHGDATGATVARVDTRLLASGAPDAFAVTLEPEGGVRSPSGPIVLVGSVSKG
jgi:anti-sigma-K factor RskA